MVKHDSKRQTWLKNRNKRKQKIIARKARIKKARLRKQHTANLRRRAHLLLLRQRRNLLESIQSEFTYESPAKAIEIKDSFGLEVRADRSQFLDNCEQIINFNAETLVINFNNTKRVWPSAVTLLVSLSKWVEQGVKFGRTKEPLLMSSTPNDPVVAGYLVFCL